MNDRRDFGWMRQLSDRLRDAPLPDSLVAALQSLEPPLRAVESDSNGGQLVVPSTELAAWCEGPQGAEWERRARMQSQRRIRSPSKQGAASE